MAATFSISTKATNFGAAFARMMTLTGDTSYPAGGYAVTAGACDLPSLGYLMMGDGVSAGGYLWRVDQTNLKLVAYSIPLSVVALAATQVATGTDMTAEVISFMAIQGN